MRGATLLNRHTRIGALLSTGSNCKLFRILVIISPHVVALIVFRVGRDHGCECVGLAFFFVVIVIVVFEEVFALVDEVGQLRARVRQRDLRVAVDRKVFAPWR